MASFTGTLGNDLFQGTAVADDFTFDLANFKAGDIVNGGGAAGDPLDRLILTAPTEQSLNFKVFEFTTVGSAAPSSYVSSIEQVYLPTSAIYVFFTSAFLNSSSTGSVEIFGSGIGVDNIQIVDGNFFEPLRTTKVTVTAGAGADTIVNYASFNFQNHVGDVLDGGDDNDTIVGSGTLNGGNGADTITVYGNGTHANGGADNDTFIVDFTSIVSPAGSAPTNAVIDGGTGDNTAQLGGFAAGMTLTNIQHITLLNGSFLGTAADYVALQAYNSILQLPVGSTPLLTVSGSGVFDFRLLGNGAFDNNINVDYTTPSSAITIYGTSGHNAIAGSTGGDLTVYGGISDDVLSAGFNSSATLNGGAGADQLSGGPGNDTLIGDLGNDYLVSGNGTDSLFGGDGADALFSTYTGVSDRTYMQGDAGNDYMQGSTGNDAQFGGDGGDNIHGLGGQDYIQGDAGNDVVFGEDGNDNVFGGLGDDTVVGGNGADYVDGNENNDFVYGGAGNDVVYGGSGNDAVSGGAGNDNLGGGAGADIFDLRQDVIVGDNDFLFDVTLAQGDQIWLPSWTSTHMHYYTVSGGAYVVIGEGATTYSFSVAGLTVAQVQADVFFV